MSERKRCFVIAPIGSVGSDVRKRSDQILKHVIRPAVEACGYSPIRADEISTPGLITSQAIRHIIEDDLVVADLTGHNPNVFYELAIRHSLDKPVIHLIENGEAIPFDIADVRTILVDHHDLDSAMNARHEIAKQIREIESHASPFENPISATRYLLSARRIQSLSVSTFVAGDRPEHVVRISKAIELLTEALGLVITEDSPPERGSWFKRWRTRSRELLTTFDISERLNVVKNVLEHTTQEDMPESFNKAQADAVLELLRALEPFEQASIRLGSLLVIKGTDSNSKPIIHVLNLSGDTVKLLEEKPDLMKNPDTLLYMLMQYGEITTESDKDKR